MQDSVIAGRYRLDSQIGAGGTSRVYSATDLRLDRAVAVKVLDALAVSSADPQALRRFQGEARSLAGFSHPNVVHVYDAGTTAAGDPFIVLELVDGPSLAAVLHDRGPLPVGEAVRITESLLDALGAAHAAGMVHRDVKPGNVLFNRQGTAKLADFGIARRFDQMQESLTAAGMVIGTPRYLAPEQAAGQTLTPATDVFAAGLLLQEMLVGSQRAAEFDRPTVIELSAARPDVGAEIQGVIRQALHPDPKRRFQSTAAMAAALRHAATTPAALPSTSVLAPTTVAPTAAMARHAAVAASDPPRRGASMWWLLIATLVAATVVGIVLASNRNEPGPSTTTAASNLPTEMAGPPATTETSVAAPSSTATTTTPPTNPPDTTLPVTQPPPPPSTATPLPTLSDLVAAADLPAFHEMLTANPDAVGKHGKELQKTLDKIMVSLNSAKTADRLAELSDQVQKWKSDGSLDEPLADSLLSLIDDFEDQF